MNIFAALIIHTANILGSFQDPFEFDGNYGEEVNPIRMSVFEQVVSKEALAKNLIDGDEDFDKETLIAQGRLDDLNHGPTISELIPNGLLLEFINKQAKLQEFSSDDLSQILSFIERYSDKKLFYFLKNVSSDLLSLDKILRDVASRENKNLQLPILSSLEPLQGQSSLELKINLMDQLFTKEVLKVVKPQTKVKPAIDALSDDFLKTSFGTGINSNELYVFSTPIGQVFFYWLYQILNLHLVSEDISFIDQINFVKEEFAKTLGDSKVRAHVFRDKLIAAGTSVLFTQESDALTKETLLDENLFLPVDIQNGNDGTYVFLKRDDWKEDYEVVPFENYDGFARGRLNVILAETKTGQKFLLAAGHGNSTKSEDGRLQIALVLAKHKELSEQYENLQLIIGIDANTKTEKDVALLKDQLETLGLVSTNTGPTTIKKRMVTVQHEKACKLAIDEEDYLIVLKEDHGGLFSLIDVTIGFSADKPDINEPLPNIGNQSDHYPVGATLY